MYRIAYIIIKAIFKHIGQRNELSNLKFLNSSQQQQKKKDHVLIPFFNFIGIEK